MPRGASLRGADGNITIGTQVDVGGINTGLYKIEKSFKRLERLSAGVLSGMGLLKFGKEALSAASDLQEVQNIVDVTFGNMEDKVEKFASVCIDQFGMSELSAKQTAGSFMAMGNAMGLSQENASNMAIQLTALTGDFASFYNISQDYARVALSAVYTGETETLKRYGIVVTEANLQQFALSKGIQGTVRNMGAQEKAMLRYQYVMEATKDMQGDFVRTQDNWANQLRVLKERWTQFMIVIGDGLITIFNPLLTVLNNVVAALIRFAKIIGSILQNIFGFNVAAAKQTEVNHGIADSADDAADATNNLANATKKAGKAAKQALSPLDELNIISENVGSGSGSGGGGLTNEEFPIDDITAGMSLVDKMKEKLSSDIDTLYGLGQYISFTLRDMLMDIDWDSIYAGAENFGTGLAEFLNGLFQPSTFYQVGRTIANSLNTAIYTTLAFATEFDWSNFGNSLAEGVNGFFRNFDFGALADDIDAWVQGIFTTITTFIENVDWSQVWKGVTKFLSHIDVETIDIVLAAVTITKIGKVILGANVLGKLAEMLSAQFGITHVVMQIGEVIALVAGGAGTVAEALAAVFSPLQGIMAIVGGIVLAVVNFFDMLKNGFSWIKEILMIIGIALAAIGAVILGAPAAIAAVIAGIVAVVANLVIAIVNHWEDIVKAFKDFGAKCVKEIEMDIQFFKNIFNAVVNFVIDLVKKYIDYTIAFFKACGDAISAIVEGLGEMIRSIVTNIYNFIKLIIDTFIALWKAEINIITTVASTVYTFVRDYVVTPIWNFIKKVIDWILTGVTNLVDGIKSVVKTIASFVSKKVIDPIVSAVDGMWKGIKKIINMVLGGFEKMANGIASGMNLVISGLNKIKVDVPDWIPGVGGKKFGFDMAKIGHISIPRLANGAVIPPNKEFMAVLGDQKHGTNIEAPLETIQNAVADIMSPYLQRLVNLAESINDKDFTTYIGDREIAQAAVRGQRQIGVGIRKS